jgi:hypothetical protein
MVYLVDEKGNKVYPSNECSCNPCVVNGLEYEVTGFRNGDVLTKREETQYERAGRWKLSTGHILEKKFGVEVKHSCEKDKILGYPFAKWEQCEASRYEYHKTHYDLTFNQFVRLTNIDKYSNVCPVSCRRYATCSYPKDGVCWEYLPPK